MSESPADGVWKVAPMHYEALVEMLNRYFSLVWYARSSHPAGANGRRRVERLYADEVAKLRSATSDWQHGFNSGALATLRLVIDLLVKEKASVVRIQTGVIQLPVAENSNSDASEDSEPPIDEVVVAMQAFDDFPLLDT